MKKDFKNIFSGLVATYTFLMTNLYVFAATTGGDGGASNISAKLTTAGNTVKTVLTGLVVLVGICVGLFIIIKRMPSADDPHEKNEVFKSIGRVCALVGLAAALIWLLPWVYGLFT